MVVLFKNLLEENFEDIQFGLLDKEGNIHCLCGCEGIFEEEDYKIIKKYKHLNVSDILKKEVK